MINMVTFQARINKNKKNSQHSINIPAFVFSDNLLEYNEDREYTVEIHGELPDGWVIIGDKKYPLRKKDKMNFVIDDRNDIPIHLKYDEIQRVDLHLIDDEKKYTDIEEAHERLYQIEMAKLTLDEHIEEINKQIKELDVIWKKQLTT